MGTDYLTVGYSDAGALSLLQLAPLSRTRCKGEYVVGK